MIDEKKVVKGLECCTHDIPLSNNAHKSGFCKECPYRNSDGTYCFNQVMLMKEALALIREQKEEIEKWVEAYSQY